MNRDTGMTIINKQTNKQVNKVREVNKNCSKGFKPVSQIHRRPENSEKFGNIALNDTLGKYDSLSSKQVELNQCQITCRPQKYHKKTTKTNTHLEKSPEKFDDYYGMQILIKSNQEENKGGTLNIFPSQEISE